MKLRAFENKARRGVVLGTADYRATLVENGAEVDAHHDRDGRTPLYFAALEDSIDVVRFLVENGADVNPRSAFGTPLDIALSNGYEEVANYLRSQGGIERETY